MKNRNVSFPILSTVALSLVAHAPLFAQAQTVVPAPATAAAAPAPTTSGAAAATAPKHAAHTISYTVVAGDSLTSIAQKFHTTRKNLRKLNDLAASVVKVIPGESLLVPASLKSAKPKASALAAKTPTAEEPHDYLVAQPVQDFDITASTFASRPAPVPSPEDNPVSPAPAATEKPAPVAKPVSPAELAAESQENVAPPQPRPLAATAQTHSTRETDSFPQINSTARNEAPRHLSLNQAQTPASSTSASDWGNRFLRQARFLGDQGIEYDDDWRPPGESHAWAMDCSNTARYLYKVTTGIELPRTASDQYYYLHLQGKAWDVPQLANGLPDTVYLRENLKPGDLLFWENTYRPEREPPITHVMVFLGTNAQGQWIMAGSQTSRGGEHNRPNGGPDIYVFRPSQPCGGYTTWLGLVHHQGRFCAFGRPLEADPSKLAVAENN
jgi:cell wall-associated NlpC family hydrolase